MGRRQSRGRGNGKGGRGNFPSKLVSSKGSRRKTLEDYHYDIGSSKNASEYVSTTKFLISRIATTFIEADDIVQALEQGEHFDHDDPAVKPSLGVSLISGTTPDEIAKRDKENEEFKLIFAEEGKAHVARQSQYRQNRPKAAALIMGRCTDRLKTKLQQRSDWDKIEKDPVLLLAAIKEHAMNYEATQYRMKTITDALKNMVNLKQNADESLTDYLKRSKAATDVLYSHVGKRFCFPKLVEADKDYAATETRLENAIASQNQAAQQQAMKDITAIESKVTDEFRAFLFMENADRTKYGSLLTVLETQHSLGNDQYPKSLVDAHTVLANHNFDPEYFKSRDKRKEKSKKAEEEKGSSNKKTTSEDRQNLNMSFNQVKKKGLCYCCGKTHALADCPDKSTTPKNDWYINKLKQSKSVNAYNEIYQEIKEVLAPTPSVAAPAPAPTPSPTVSTVTSPSSMGWQWFTFVGAGVQEEADDLKDTMVLDSGSSIDLMCNPNFLQDITVTTDPCTLQTNGGQVQVVEEGLLPGYGRVPYHSDAMTNLMSLAKLTDQYRVTFDSSVDNAFYVYTPDKTVRFGRNAANLYTHKPKGLSQEQQQQPKTETVFVQSVEENMKFHTPREIKRAKAARDLLAALGTPSMADLKAAIAMNAISDLPVRTVDIDLAEKIFGPDLGTLKGKTTKRKALPMVSDRIAIPPELYEKREALELCMDLMYVNGMVFFTSITRALYYRTASPIPNRTAEALYEGLDEVLRLYNSNGFTISKIYCDQEFKPLMDDIKDNFTPPIDMDYCATNKHVPEAERNNRVLKERIRAAFHRLPFRALPKLVMKVLVMETARKLNYFPAKHGISQHYSPRQIVHQEKLDFKKHCQYYLGQYVQAHDEHDPRNTQQARTIEALYLRPVRNGHEVYDLATGNIINRAHLTPLPITPQIIAVVHAIARKDRQQGLRLTDLNGVLLYDSTWTAGVDYDETDGEEDYDSEAEDSDEECSTTDDETESDTDSDSEDEEEDDQSEANRILYEDEQSTGVHRQGTAQADAGAEQEEMPEEEEPDQGIPEAPQPEERTRPTRNRQAPTLINPSGGRGGTAANYLQTDEAEAEQYEWDIARYAVNLLQAFKERTRMTARKIPRKKQKACYLVTYSLQKGLKKFKSRGFNAAKGEMKQLHDRSCWQPINVSTLSASERKKALESLIFLVEKKDGKIKARHCANGSKQRQWMRSDEAASPTVMTESVLLTAGIEAKENRDVATYDIPNAFIQTHVEERDAQGDRIVMKIRGAMVDMLLEIDETYRGYVVMENGQKTLYVHILRAIYGMLMSGLLFYKKFRASIERIGYEVNPYDPCVANKIINGKQHTISWHVDDLKSSHVDPKVNDDFQQWLQKEYGQVKEITATRGKRHVYLGMTLDYSTPGEVKVDMIDYVKEMLEEFPQDLNGKSATVANEKLFDTTRGKPLGPMKAEAFHAMVAKALFLTMRARPDIRLAVAFLCTRVKESTTYDWFKLVRMMDFLKRTETECLTIALDDSKKVTWSIDAAFAVHPDMKSHSGMTMKMGKGAITSLSRKQKLNTRSSTEAELVAVDDCMAQVLWTKYFLQAQGYETKAHIILQDNESSIRLENNGHKSMGQRSRHINVRYFFITDNVKKGNVTIEYCPTDEMEGDYMSKALQGFKYGKFRRSIMNLRD